MMNNVVVMIPARYGSSRLEGKPLMDIHGKPMVIRVVETAQKVSPDLRVFVVTDSEKIGDCCLSHGVDYIMTSQSHESGTDRIAEAVSKLREDGRIAKSDVIVNIQGDEPLLTVDFIEGFIDFSRKSIADKSSDMTTSASVISSYKDLVNPNVVKVVLAAGGKALYFSRAPIPWNRDDTQSVVAGLHYRHIGIYGYSVDFLADWARSSLCLLEDIEKLEQLRALYLGSLIRVKTVTEQPHHGVDTIEDLERVREVFADANAC